MNPLAQAVQLALLGMALVAALGASPAARAASPQPLDAVAVQSYELPAGPLGRTLAGFAVQAGIALSFEPALTEGLRSPPLQGRFSAREAATRLLAGSGLSLVLRSDGSYTLQKAALTLEEATLPVVRAKAKVERETATGPVLGFVATRSATATKTDSTLLEIPQSLSVIGRDEIESHGFLSTREALRYTAGVQTEPWGIDDRPYQYATIRGFDPASYLDGLRLPSSPSGWTFGSSESYGLERVEVLRGPSSVLFGQGDVGGLVNWVSKLPRQQAVNEVELQLGGNALRQLGIDLGGSADAEGRLLWRFVGLSQERNSQHDFPGFKPLGASRQYLAPSLTWLLSPATRLTLHGSYLQHRSPGNFAEYVYDQGGRSGVLTDEPGYTHFEQKQWGIGYKLEHRFDSGWRLQQDLRTASQAIPDHTTLSAYGRADPVSGILPRTNVLVDELLRSTAVDTRLLGSFVTGAVEHHLLVGVDGLRSHSDVENTYSPKAPSLDIHKPVYGVGVSRPGAAERSSDYSEIQHLAGLYLQDQIKFGPHWQLTLGGRQDWVKSRQNNRLNGEKTGANDQAFTGRAGLSYLASSGLAPYLSYSESFLPTTGKDGQGEPFKPTRGQQVELGVKYQPSGARTLLTAAVYELSKTHVVSYDPVTFAGHQRGEICTRGLELEAKASLVNGLDLTAQYSFNNVATTRDSNPGLIGKRPVGVSRHLASVWLDYTIQSGELSGLGFGAGARYREGFYGDDKNSVSNRSITLVDATLHYTSGPWRLALNGSNLFDQEQGSYAWGVYWPGVKRALTASLRYQF
ncbi:iron complex outermembrane receptor protein [Paucibacter oligotrophus]|uniref:Iron complex outermembrane receptor protein n=1 Tax=Roseateles oligotrophus TaxID=1769250 RepID=A0A840L6S4_9BURK|nr:TonB-dependent siderophore receptor [Roseateles oligotrophus]MBB4844274.1 iron complex outermembrane receptor protein [Roseateles oligotrophus]